MRIITLNVNGIRAAARKGFYTWLAQQDADMVCLQELKAQPEQLDSTLYHPEGYHFYFCPAQKPGYSGVAIYSREPADRVIENLGWESADNEGRYLQMDIGSLSVVSLYLPSGSSGDARQAVKFDFLDRYLAHLKKQRNDKRDYIICGDWNIVHKEIDIKNWKSNQKNSGCLPEERAWLDQVFNDVGFVDAFRVKNHAAEQYTWWSNRGQAWAKNVGWRIDYHVVTPAIAERIHAVTIYKDERFSDHAPLIVDYSI